MYDRSMEAHEFLSAEERSAIAEIEASTSVLRLVTRMTQMRFAAIAKFTDTEWVTCSVYDPEHLGFEPGECALVETTICNEFKLNPQALLIPEISKHERFAVKPIVKRFELESYAGVPIFLPDGRMYGALCALDSRSVPLEDPDIGETLGLFARLIGCIFFANLTEHEPVQSR